MLLITLFVLVVLSGVWHIPVASDILYKEPGPIRNVEPAVFSEKLLQIQTRQQAEDALFGTLSVDLSEEQLNALFQETVASQSSYPFSFSQLVIEPTFIEFYGRLASQPNILLRGHAIPTADAGDMRITLDKAFIGRLPIPHFLIPSTIVETFTPSLVSGILDVAPVESVDLTTGHLILTVRSL